MNDVVVLLVIYGTLFILSPLIVMLHELGHALAYLTLTKSSKIDIYIGSYGDATNNIVFKTGKLNFIIKRSFPFVKGIGLCASDKPETDYRKYIVILLAGAVFTFVSAGIVALIAFGTSANFLVQVACYIFLGLSFVSLLSNLIPRDIRYAKKNELNSDGSKLLLTLQIKNKLPDYVEAFEQIDKKNYAAATASLKSVMEASPKNRRLLAQFIPAALEARMFKEAELSISMLESIPPVTTDTLFYRGCLYSMTGQHDQAVETYSTIINKKDKNHILALTNIGYELVEKGAHQVAKRALDRAIKLNPTFPQPYANLAYSKIIQGELKEGKKLIDTCLELNEYIADAYKALGVYHLKLKDKVSAAANFEKAAALDDTIDLTIHLEELALLGEQSSTAVF